MTTPPTNPNRVHKDGDVGRCQHCQQTRPLFHVTNGQWHGVAANEDAWLCARDYSAHAQAIEDRRPFRIDHDLVVWPENEPKVRAYLADRCNDDATGIYRGEDFGPCVDTVGHAGPHVDTDDNRWMRAEEAAAASSGSGAARADGGAS